MHEQNPPVDDDEPDVTMNDANPGEGGPGEDPDFDEAGEGVDDAPRDQES